MLTCGFETISASHFRPETLRKGKDLVKHVGKVQEKRTAASCILTATCIRETSLSEPPYIIELKVDPVTRFFQEGHCNCVSGVNAECKHAAAFNQERTEGKTDAAQLWAAPSQRLQLLYPKGALIGELVTGNRVRPHKFDFDEDMLKDLSLKLEKFDLTE